MPRVVRRLLSKAVMPKIIPMNPMRQAPRFKFTVNHRALEPMLADADRLQPKAAAKKAKPSRQVVSGPRRDD